MILRRSLGLGAVATMIAAGVAGTTRFSGKEGRPDREVILKLLADAQWHPVDPTNPNSPQMAQLWGDPQRGAYGALLLVPAGFESPLHRHSHAERVIVISGTAIHWTEDESRDKAPAMTAGDYLLMPAGLNHVSAAAPGQDCLEFITQDGAFDFTLA